MKRLYTVSLEVVFLLPFTVLFFLDVFFFGELVFFFPGIRKLKIVYETMKEEYIYLYTYTYVCLLLSFLYLFMASMSDLGDRRLNNRPEI